MWSLCCTYIDQCASVCQQCSHHHRLHCHLYLHKEIPQSACMKHITALSHLTKMSSVTPFLFHACARGFNPNAFRPAPMSLSGFCCCSFTIRFGSNIYTYLFLLPFFLSLTHFCRFLFCFLLFSDFCFVFFCCFVSHIVVVCLFANTDTNCCLGLRWTGPQMIHHQINHLVNWQTTAL